jgi:D-aspartate ligase
MSTVKPPPEAAFPIGITPLAAALPREERSATPLTTAPVLLADATWYGTLAAVRDLGSRGVPVIVAYDSAVAVSRWSRYAERTVASPNTRDVSRFVEWLHDFGRRNPGAVLYPTSDDVAFVIAAHRATLEPHFQLFTPTVDALLSMLDKSRLAASAQRAGLQAAPTWSPDSEEELLDLAPALPLPLLVKPRAQILSAGSKGIRVDRREDLLEAWRTLRATAAVHPQALEFAPGLDRPIVQPYAQVAESIYTVDGFVDGGGNIVGALACVKRLQLPRRSGPGVLFEAAPLDAAILAGMQRLFQATGYVGVFDAEFVIQGDEKLLIDLNPRFYNHMAFEIDRGLPLPWITYLTATGQADAIPGALFAARRRAAGARGVYAHRLPLQLMLTAQRWSGRMNDAECRRWRRLVAEAGVLTDPAHSRDDARPAWADIAQHLRHPRALLRKAAR